MIVVILYRLLYFGIDNGFYITVPQKLRQCLINILKNAIESMPNGGYVWVTCIRAGAGNIEIIVQDEGIGMSQEQIDRLGTPFYSLKES